MILTVTLNPLLERRYYYKKIEPGKNNRDGRLILKAGGKGINVSRQLNCLGIDNLAYTFAGGANGKLYREVLTSGNIKAVSVKTRSETREASVLVEEDEMRVTTCFIKDREILPAEVEEFKQKLVKMIENCEMVVFSGSSPCAETDTVFPFGIETAREFDKISVCDTYGSHLRQCLDKSPTIVHNNVEEIEKSLNISLSNEDEIFAYLDNLYRKNIKQVYLTDGLKPVYSSNFDFKFKTEFPALKAYDSAGCGDSFTAGIIYGWENGLTYEQTLAYASALGMANAVSEETSAVKPGSFEQYMEKVIISPVGKKLYTIDVTPQ